MWILEIGDIKQEITITIASILARKINKKIAKTKTCFLVLS